MRQLNDLRNSQTWRQHAACQGLDTKLFFPDAEFGTGKKVFASEAREACETCPVQPDCLNYAITNQERYGMWGGKTPAERKRMSTKES